MAYPSRPDSPPLSTVEPWPTFLQTWKWSQGEHVTLIGPTGAGKTTLARAILPRRAYVAVVATKPRDPVVLAFRRAGYEITRRWPSPWGGDRVLFWPKIERFSDLRSQQDAIGGMLSDVYRRGGWTLYLDEARYVTEYLDLSREVELLWLQGRALGVSMVAAAQRPRHLPLAAYSQASHLFVWRTRDRADLRRLDEMSGYWSADSLERTIGTLPEHHALHLAQGSDKLAVTKVV